jgi:hypothetical protein
VELMLTLVLLLCLAAASVFSYTALHRTANLDEGVNRLESLIRFAQAEAATTGRKVQLQFPASSGADEMAGTVTGPVREIKVMWEPDFLNSPGVFQQYTNKTWSEDMVNELVSVAKVRSVQPDRPTPMVADSLPEVSTDLPSEVEASMAPETNDAPSITFYPDGSCDSAEIFLASRNSEDSRMLEVRLSGILGSISSRIVPRKEAENLDQPETLQDQPEMLQDQPETLTQPLGGDRFAAARDSNSTQSDADEFDF